MCTIFFRPIDILQEIDAGHRSPYIHKHMGNGSALLAIPKCVYRRAEGKAVTGLAADRAQ